MINFILSYINYISMSIKIYYAISDKLLIHDIMVVSMHTVKGKDGFGNKNYKIVIKLLIIILKYDNL